MRNPGYKITATLLAAVILLLSAVVSQSLDMGSHALGDSESLFVGRSAALGSSETYITGEEGALVGSYGELIAAIAARERYIRLTADFTITKGIELDYDVTIDGRKQDDSGNWRITEVPETDGDTRYVFRVKNDGRTINIVNLDITGYNFYGFVTQRDSDNAARGCTVVYTNVHYQGPQLAYMPYDSTLKIVDSVIELVENNGGHPAQELGEATQFILEGNTRIYKEQGTESLFWVINLASTRTKNGLVQIEDDSDVTIYNAQTYFFYREDRVNISNFEFIVGDNTTAHLYARRGWCETEVRFINHFEIGDGSTVTMARSNADTGALFYVRDSIRVGKGSTWILEDSIPTLSIGDNRTTLTLDEPRLVRIEQGLAKNSFASVDITARAINHWSGTNNNWSAKPTGQFNAPGGEMVDLRGNASSATLSYLDGETGGKVEAAGNAFVPSTAQNLFVAGDYGLEVGTITAHSTRITGAMNGDASLIATYFPQGADTGSSANYHSSVAVFDPEFDEQGLSGFAVTPEAQDPPTTGAFEPGTKVIFDMTRSIEAGGYLTRSTPLHITELREVLTPGTITLAEVPRVLQFGRNRIPSGTAYIPLKADAELIVVDDRNAPEQGSWHVTAQATQPADDRTGATLPQRSLGLWRSGGFTTLADPVRVWQGDHSVQAGEQRITWQAGEREGGFVMEIDPYHAQAADFISIVTWTLVTGA